MPQSEKLWTAAGKKETVNSQVYVDEAVKDGFLESIEKLKTKDYERLAKGRFQK